MDILDFNNGLLMSSIEHILCLAANKQDYWKSCLERILSYSNRISMGIHLAIFREPYLKFILEGKKTVESRFSTRQIAPYQKVYRGDILLLKLSGGPIVGLCEVIDVWFYRLNPQKWLYIKKNFTQFLCVQDSNFWSEQKQASFGTLMQITHPTTIEPIRLSKRDRRGWVVLLPHKKNNETLDIWV